MGRVQRPAARGRRAPATETVGTVLAHGLRCALTGGLAHRVLKPVYDLPYRGFGKPGRLPHVVQANEFNANQWVDEQQVPYTHDPTTPTTGCASG